MDVRIDLVDTISSKVASLPEDTRRRLRVVMVRDGKELLARARAKVSGPVLKVRSGRLLASLRAQMRETSAAITMEVFTQGVPYAAIHEYGGKTSPHLIVPKTARALHFFNSGGVEVFARVVHHPGSVLPERSYLRSSLAELQGRITANIIEAARPHW